MFQTMTMFASNVRAPEIVPSSSIVRPCFAVIMRVVDGALKAVDRLSPLVEQIEDLHAENRVAEVVAEIDPRHRGRALQRLAPV